MTTDEAQKIIADCGMIPSNTDYSTSDEYIQNHELEHKIVEFMQNNYTDLVADPNISQLGENLSDHAGCSSEDVLRAGSRCTGRNGLSSETGRRSL